MHHCTDIYCRTCTTPRYDLSREFAKLAGALAGSITHDLIRKHRPLLALKAKIITWKQFRHLRVQEPVSK